MDQQSVSPNHMDCSKEQHMEDAIEVIHSPQRSHVLIEKVSLNNENVSTNIMNQYTLIFLFVSEFSLTKYLLGLYNW